MRNGKFQRIAAEGTPTLRRLAPVNLVGNFPHTTPATHRGREILACIHSTGILINCIPVPAGGADSLESNLAAPARTLMRTRILSGF